MADRIRYPSAAYPGNGLSADGSAAIGIRAREVDELRRDVPDCVSIDPQRKMWALPVLLPYPTDAASGVQTVTLQLEVPLDYPSTSAVLKVTPVIQHLWVNSETGVLAIEDHIRKLTLKQMVLDGYVAISGSQYVPQQRPSGHTTSRPTPEPRAGDPSQAYKALPSTASWQSLQIQIEAKLSGMSDGELCLLITDQAAFSQELHTWLKETGAGKQYIQAHKHNLQAAQSNKDLVAEYEGTEQQVRVTQSAEVEPSMLEHDDLLAQQAAVLSKVDLASLVAKIQAIARNMDTGESEKVEIISRGAGDELSHAAISAKIACYKQKRQTLHEADIRAKAAAQLQR